MRFEKVRVRVPKVKILCPIGEMQVTGGPTISTLHYFLNLIADSNSATPKTPESKFSSHGKIHTLRTDYSLDCREGLTHKNKFVCMLVCLQVHGGLIFARYMCL